jgi:hypothetical protein
MAAVKDTDLARLFFCVFLVRFNGHIDRRALLDRYVAVLFSCQTEDLLWIAFGYHRASLI